MKKYEFLYSEDPQNGVPKAVFVTRNDDVCEELGLTCSEYDDVDAAEDAMADGVKLLSGMPPLYDNYYLDTPENRELITGWFALHAEYFATHSETMVS